MARRRYPLLLAFAFLSAALHAVPPPRPEQTEWIQKKLERIIIPRLEFREVGTVQAVEFLRKKAVELDPLRAGVPIYLRMQPAVPAPARPITTIPGVTASSPPFAASPTDAKITVSLTNIPLSEALRYLTSLAGLKFRVMPDGVHIVPLDDPDPLYDREFLLDPVVLDALQQVPTEAAVDHRPHALIRDVKDFLSSEGIVFGAGATAVIDESKTRLRVRNTVAQFDLIEAILADLHPKPEPPVPGPEVPKVIWPDGSEIPREQHKAERLVLGRVSIVNSTLREAVNHLKERSMQDDRETDPNSRGVNIVIKAESASTGVPDIPGLEPLANTPEPVAIRINYSAQKVSLADAAEAVATLAGMRVRYRSYSIVFVRENESRTPVTVEYLVPPEFNGSSPILGDLGRVPLNEPPDRDWFLSSGVQFGPNASAIYIPASRKLIVRNTVEKQGVVKEIVERLWKEYYKAYPPAPTAPSPLTAPRSP